MAIAKCEHAVHISLSDADSIPSFLRVALCSRYQSQLARPKVGGGIVLVG